jgi:hypothetical protein
MSGGGGVTSHLEQQFVDMWAVLYPHIDLHRKYRFSPPRLYRWDFCHLSSKVAIDIQSVVSIAKPGHSDGTGLPIDFLKLNLAASQGWRVFQLAEAMITEECLGSIANAIQQSELPNNDLLGNSQTKTPRKKKNYKGHIKEKTIRNHHYYYWIYYDHTKRVEEYVGTNRSKAEAYAKERTRTCPVIEISNKIKESRLKRTEQNG